MNKKIVSSMLAFLIVISSIFSRSYGEGVNSEKGEIPVLLYHSVVDEVGAGIARSMNVSTENFRRDLEYLKNEGYETISLSDYEKHIMGEKIDLPEKPILITFDDGYRNNYINAYPLLKEYNQKAVIYTILWSMGRDKTLDGTKDIFPHFSVEEGREMLKSGLIEFGTHTFDLHNPEGISYGEGRQCGTGLLNIKGESPEEHYERIYEDIKFSIDLLKYYFKTDIKSIAYPYGRYDDTVLSVIKDLGFTSGFVTERNYENPSNYEIRRIEINEDLRVEDVFNPVEKNADIYFNHNTI